jgi:hypothetical protein
MRSTRSRSAVVLPASAIATALRVGISPSPSRSARE